MVLEEVPLVFVAEHLYVSCPLNKTPPMLVGIALVEKMPVGCLNSYTIPLTRKGFFLSASWMLYPLLEISLYTLLMILKTQ